MLQLQGVGPALSDAWVADEKHSIHRHLGRKLANQVEAGKAKKALVAVAETTTGVARGAAITSAVDLEKEVSASAHPASKPRVPRVAEIPAKVMQVCLRTSRGAAFHRLRHDMPITNVKRLLIEVFCSNLTRSPFTIAFAVKRLWHQTWLKCNGRRLAEECTLQSSNVGANAIIDLEVSCHCYNTRFPCVFLLERKFLNIVVHATP